MRRLGWAGGVVGVVVAVAGIASSGRLALPVPLSDVPQTAQTLAVLATGIVLGSRLGAVAVAAYLAAGAAGLPVFAEGASGLETLVGPTGGFLVGFLAAAAIAGWWVEAGGTRRLASGLLGMGTAHAAVLLLGWAWLARSIGPTEAWELGVAPFLVGAILKSLLAALLAKMVSRRRAF